MSDTTDGPKLERLRQALIRASQGKDLGEAREAQELWGEFFQQYNRILIAFAHKAGCPPGSIEDVLTAVWDRVEKALPGFIYDRERGGFRRWLFRIVTRTAIDVVRRLRRRREVSLDAETTNVWQQIGDREDSKQDDPLTRLCEEELARCLLAEFAKEASQNEQEIVKRMVMGGQSAAEVAAALDLKEGNVRQIKLRALARLKIIAVERFGLSPTDD